MFYKSISLIATVFYCLTLSLPSAHAYKRSDKKEDFTAFYWKFYGKHRSIDGSFPTALNNQAFIEAAKSPTGKLIKDQAEVVNNIYGLYKNWVSEIGTPGLDGVITTKGYAK